MARQTRDEYLQKKRQYYQEHKDYFKQYWKTRKKQKGINRARSNAKYKIKHPEKYKAMMRECQRVYRTKIKYATLTHFSDGKMRCARCGESRPACLTIDHIKGGGRQHRLAIGTGDGTQFYRWLLKNGSRKDFQVLCMNCQWVKRFEGRETYRNTH